MLNLPKMHYFILSLLIIMALTGCQMRRDDSADLSTTTPPTPTLASLGVDSAETTTELPTDATPVPTIINVQPTATDTMMGAGQEAENAGENVAPTSQVIEMAITPLAHPAEPETFVPPAEDSNAAAPIIVNAASAELPDGGPIAANPPEGQPTSFAAPSADNAVYGGSTYIVQSGDTLFSISLRYATTVEAFMDANNLNTADIIYEGQVLNIPGDGNAAYNNTAPPAYNQAPADNFGTYNNNSGYHTVGMGETLFSIALGYGTSVEAVAATNGLFYPYIIYEGQTLIIPAQGAAPQGYYQQQPEVQDYPSNGYYQEQPQQPAYPPSDIAGTHTVAPGETLFSIAQYYGTSAQFIAEANGLTNPNQIYVGQVLYLP